MIVRQRKKSRDGIYLYQPSRKESHTSYRKRHVFLLAAVRLAAVWSAAAAWWKSLTSVFPMEVDSVYLYISLFLLTAVLTLLWNIPVRVIGKIMILVLLCGGAAFWIRLHMDVAAGVINSAANAYLSVCKPDAALYPVQAVTASRLAVMTGIFMVPLLLIWSVSLSIRRGKVLSVLLLLAPAVLSLVVAKVPSELSCWLLILSGGFFSSVYSCKSGQAAFVNGMAAACILGLITGFAQLASRPLEQYKEPPDGFYAETRVYIRTKWIEPAGDYIQEVQEMEKARKEAAKREHEEEQTPGETDSLDETKDPDETDRPDEAQTSEDPPDTAQTPEPEVNTVAGGLEHPLFKDEGGQPDDNGGADSQGGSAAGFPDLNSLSHFQPDAGVRMTVSLDTKPEETFYYPEAYGGIYEDSHWSGAASDDAVSEEHMQYPDTLPRLKELCDGHVSNSLDEVTDFIRQELEENTVYDYEPGATPEGKNFAEYFLFENQKGFCVHFATTAALMYRLCGFPSRYVQGYAVPAAAFHRQEDGSYLAEVTGEMGHAWCEVYSGSQWILKEHTLPYRGVRPEPGRPAAASGEHTWVPNAAGWMLRILKIAAVILASLFLVAILLVLQAAVRRQHKYRRFQRRQGGVGIQSIYRAIYDAAVFHGMEKTDFLNQKGFEALQKYRPEMDAASMEWLYKAVLETMFYERGLTKEELWQALSLYRQFSKIIKTELNPCRRFIYRYIRVL